MGKLSQTKLNLAKALSKVNDRAFSLITIFSVSVSVTMLDIMFNLTNKINNLYTAFIALAVLVVVTIISSCSDKAKSLRIIGASICVFLWLFVANLSGVLHSGVWLHSAVFYAVLFWSNINLLGVFLNARK